jgi:flagellar basal body-associated protein FliL
MGKKKEFFIVAAIIVVIVAVIVVYQVMVYHMNKGKVSAASQQSSYQQCMNKHANLKNCANHLVMKKQHIASDQTINQS